MQTETNEARRDRGRTQMPSREVVVTDVEMPFGSMVKFIVKWAVASIPAMIILFIVFSVLVGVFGGILGGLVGL